MPDPITSEDLYGPSSPPVPEGEHSLPKEVLPNTSIPIEETPEITVNTELPVPPPPTTEPKPGPIPAPLKQDAVSSATRPPKVKGSFWSTIGAIILFVGLFGLGVWLSSYVRQYFPNGLVGITGQQQAIVNIPTPSPTPDPFSSWKLYQVISGITKEPVERITFKLPGDILAPICDTTTCMSQGTYLTGGTRFTIAPRGPGQLLADFRGSAISDVGGMVFTTQDTTVNGHAGKLFTGSFTGKTVGGYGFTQMRGYMIEVTPSMSLEINHYIPMCVTADFAADDATFDKVVSSLVMPGTPSAALVPTITVVPVATSTPVPATTSGY